MNREVLIRDLRRALYYEAMEAHDQRDAPCGDRTTALREVTSTAFDVLTERVREDEAEICSLRDTVSELEQRIIALEDQQSR